MRAPKPASHRRGDIEIPLKTIARTVAVPVSSQWQPPRFDGRVTSYFEWCIAAQVETDDDQPIRRLSIWGGSGRLFLLIEGARAMQDIVADQGLTVQFEPENGPSGHPRHRW